uniref:Salivary lipocalin n=1 Tax=Ixodes ricinus TaxID=34613 RepID=V5HQJ4_IXORI
MAGQFSTICYIIVGTIIIFPEAHSKAVQVNFDATMELRITKRFFLKYRSYREDHSVRDAKHCVSLLVMHNNFGTWDAILRYKLTPASGYINKQVKIRPHHQRGTPGTINNMMRITEDGTGRQFYDQKLQYTNYGNCRVLVEQFSGRRHCSLWVSPEWRKGAIPQLCSDAYSQICSVRHHIDDTERCL